MKKLIAIAALMLSIGVSAFAQRMNVPYVSAGVITHVASGNFNDVGGDVAFGFRNYNRQALVSFTYGGEVLGFVAPGINTSTSFGLYAIPEIGVAFGPSGFKFYPHTGFMMGYGSDSRKFGVGFKDGFAFDFGKHITLDFTTYYTFNQYWTCALNFIWRFGY